MTTTDDQATIRRIYEELVGMRREVRAALVPAHRSMSPNTVAPGPQSSSKARDEAARADGDAAVLRKSTRTLQLWAMWMLGMFAGAALMVLADALFDHIGP